MVLDKVNNRLQRFDFAVRKQRNRAPELVKNLATLDYMLNSHPNREAIFGADSAW